MVWKPFVEPQMTAIHTGKYEFQARQISQSLCFGRKYWYIFFYLPDFHQRLAVDLICVNFQPLNFVEQKVKDAHLLHSSILTEPLSCRNLGSATSFCISDLPVGRKKPSSAFLSYLDAKSLSLTLESFCPCFSIHTSNRVLVGTQALVDDCLRKPGEAWMEDPV